MGPEELRKGDRMGGGGEKEVKEKSENK